jgi:hypothetical protein
MEEFAKYLDSMEAEDSMLKPGREGEGFPR